MSGQNSQHYKKKPLRKKVQNYILGPFQNTKSTQTTRSQFAQQIKQMKAMKFDLKLLKVVNCLLKGYEKYDNIW